MDGVKTRPRKGLKWFLRTFELLPSVMLAAARDDLPTASPKSTRQGTRQRISPFVDVPAAWVLKWGR